MAPKEPIIIVISRLIMMQMITMLRAAAAGYFVLKSNVQTGSIYSTEFHPIDHRLLTMPLPLSIRKLS